MRLRRTSDRAGPSRKADRITTGTLHCVPTAYATLISSTRRDFAGDVYGLATSFVMFLILVPYCAFRSLGEVLGDQYLVRLFFVERLENAGTVAQTEEK